MRHVLLAGAALLLLAPAPGFAQQANPAIPAQPGSFGPRRTGPAPVVKAPPAFPGARAEPTEAAPANRVVTDLPPNEALFDAINRGDLTAAKDAVTRGADINSQNVLGLTPIDLAVDLGRNEISFYLLSLRGGIAGTAGRAPPAEPTRAEKLAAERAARAEAAAAKRRTQVGVITPAAPQYARLFANNGGAPVPEAGFLGFDAR